MLHHSAWNHIAQMRKNLENMLLHITYPHTSGLNLKYFYFMLIKIIAEYITRSKTFLSFSSLNIWQCFRRSLRHLSFISFSKIMFLFSFSLPRKSYNFFIIIYWQIERQLKTLSECKLWVCGYARKHFRHVWSTVFVPTTEKKSCRLLIELLSSSI